LWDQINIDPVTAKDTQFLVLFQRKSTNIDQIANWRHQGEKACKTASFMYISYCDTIRTHILANKVVRVQNCGISQKTVDLVQFGSWMRV
jgi:hypothetical protein